MSFAVSGSCFCFCRGGPQEECFIQRDFSLRAPGAATVYAPDGAPGESLAANNPHFRRITGFQAGNLGGGGVSCLQNCSFSKIHSSATPNKKKKEMNKMKEAQI